MRVLSTAIASILATKYEIDAAGIEAFVGGFVFGLIQKDDLPEIQKCLKNASSLEAEVTNAISDLSKGDVADIIKAVEEMGQIVKELPADLADCQGMTDDIAKIENWAKIFAHPTTLIETITKNLLANWSTIFGDVSKVESDWTAASYYNAGDDVADILVLTVGKPTETAEIESYDWTYLQSTLKENMSLF